MSSLGLVWVLALTFDVVTPDLLVCAVLTWYLALVVQGRYLRSVSQAWLLGLVAGVAYLAKPYAMFFICLHLLVATVAHLGHRIREPRCWLKPLACVAGGLVLLAVPGWAVCQWNMGTSP